MLVTVSPEKTYTKTVIIKISCRMKLKLCDENDFYFQLSGGVLEKKLKEIIKEVLWSTTVALKHRFSHRYRKNITFKKVIYSSKRPIPSN